MNETLRTIDGRPVLRIERWLNHPVEKVWRAITEPDQLGQWYPFPAKEMDLRVGGKILFDDDAGTRMEATIIELDPPRVFAFSEHAPEEMFRESDDLVHIELQPHEQSCLLIFTHTFDDRAGAASYATGWNACLDGLEMLLAGKPVEMIVDWVTEHERYIDLFALNEGLAEVGEDGWTVRFERQLTLPVDDTWAELTASPLNGESPTIGDHPPDGFTNQVGSPGPITEIDAPRVLEYEWLRNGHAAGRVRWELSQGTGHGARLILTQTGPSDLIDIQAKVTDEWKARIEELARHLAATHRRKG